MHTQLADDLTQRLAETLVRERKRTTGPLFVGIAGAQGSGKTTLARDLMRRMRALDLRTTGFSLDDLYLRREERLRLSRRVHPLLATRGVPGTHDPALGLKLFADLRAAEADDITPIPAFDKGIDDRMDRDRWPTHRGASDVVFFEGWCVGAPPQREDELAAPINRLEAEEDPEEIWRRWVNRQLAEAYPPLFERLDLLVFLEIPDFDWVARWRGQQERELARTRGTQATAIMDSTALLRFIAHYERLTRHMLRVMPELAWCTCRLDEHHRIVQMHFRDTPKPQSQT